jgi:glutamine amidotransferase
MCALMGLAFAKPISADFSIREFAVFSEDNADGWGLAWYPDRALTIVKEPVQWRASPHTHFLQNYPRLRSRIYVAHVRHRTTGGEPTHADTHPFARELNGREYCFAHNGTIEKHREVLPLERFHPVGGTDSERLFCHLLDELARQPKNALDDRAGWAWLHAKLRALNTFGKINCLLTDGDKLFVYHDAGGWKGLAYRQVYIRGHGTQHFEDPQIRLDLEGEPLNHGYVIASKPLTPSGWTSFKAGELIVLEGGKLRFSSQRTSMVGVNGEVKTKATPTRSPSAPR